MPKKNYQSVTLDLALLLVSGALTSCSAATDHEAENDLGQVSAALTCAALTPAQTAILKFEDASKWTPNLATLSTQQSRTEGSFSLGVKPLSGYSTISSANIATLPLGGRAISLDVLAPHPPKNPTWAGNVTAYLDVPSRGLNGVHLGYQALALGTPGVFQKLSFEIPQYAYDALLAGSYSDLKIRFGLALPEGSAPYLFDNMTFNICPAATNVTACRQITSGGSYLLQSDLDAGASSAACISIHDTQNVELDCANHSITGTAPIELRNVQSFSIRNCRMESSQTLWLSITDTSSGNLSGNTIRSLAPFGLAVVDVLRSTNMTFDNNTLRGTYQQNYGFGSTISNNRITAPPGETATTTTVAGNVVSNFGGQTKVTNNLLDGSWNGALPPLWNTNGADDAVVVHDEANLVVRDNVMRNLYDCGVEFVGTIRSASITGNRITNAGICGVGGWYWLGLANSTVSGNIVDVAGDLLLFTRSGGLRPQGFDSEHRMPADTAILFRDNVFEGNVLTNPNSYSLWSTNASSDVPVYDDLAYSPFWQGLPGERVATHADFQLTNNVFRNNDFGRVRNAPWFGNNAVVQGLIVDGGGNICKAPTPAGYPLNCH